MTVTKMTVEKEEKNVIIRPAEKSDATSIEIILSTYFLDRDDISHEKFYVAEVNGKIIGCAVFEKLKSQEDDFWFYEIHTIAVMPSYKGKGYGKLLLNRLLSEIETQITNESSSNNSNSNNSNEKISRNVLTRTTASNFFIHEGFEKADIEKTKYWEECVQCDKIEICSQTVLNKEI
ncbi:MAG: GNAT family N-acetyltransferase [Methanosarcinales archaeon]|nr:GNAT family N-acetyltransferase [Methanosarcinales archaeon]